MDLSDVAGSIKASVTLALNAKASACRERGEPVIHLGGGEPKSKAPIDAIVAATELLETREVRYTPVDGVPALKKAIIAQTQEHYNRLVEPKNVIVSGGAKQAIVVALQAILDPGEEVVFPCPYWVSYPAMVRMCRAVSVPVMPEDGTLYPKIQDIERKVTSRTKAVLINSPNNPTGQMYSEEFISDVVELCETCGLYLIMDDIYNRLVFDGRKPINCYEYAKDLSENSKLVVINGVSKQYAMTGFRIGWAVANKELIGAMTKIQGHQTSGPSAVSQKAAIGALVGAQSCVEELRATLEGNRNVMLDCLNSLDGVRAPKPDGAFYCFADFSAYEKDSSKLSNFLIDKVLVLAVPGVEFGMDGYLRLSFCGSVKDITEGIERIRWALDPNSPNEFYIGDRKIVKDWE